GPVGEEVEPADDAPAAEGHEPDDSRLAGPPAPGVARGDIEMHAPGPGAIEHQAPVHLEEREVRAHEDDVVRGVLHLDLDCPPAPVEVDRPLAEQRLARPHRAAARDPRPIAPSTCRTRMPSPKRHSILTVP